MGRGEDGDVICKAEEKDSGAIRKSVAGIWEVLSYLLEPGLKPDDELCGG